MPFSSPLFPYTTLFRSGAMDRTGDQRRQEEEIREVVAPGEVQPSRRAVHRHMDQAQPVESEPQDHRPAGLPLDPDTEPQRNQDRKSTRLNSSHLVISYAVLIAALSLHDALPIWRDGSDRRSASAGRGNTRSGRARRGPAVPPRGPPPHGSGAARRKRAPGPPASRPAPRSGHRTSAQPRSEEHTSELQSPCNLVCRSHRRSFPTRRSSDLARWIGPAISVGRKRKYAKWSRQERSSRPAARSTATWIRRSP